jgi:prepilin-type processing-associated H-X9-DG protein/prepilin-type N-terminal cleavage/methylation domain-containing protein
MRLRSIHRDGTIRSRTAFTIVELMVVIAIVAVVLGLLMVAVQTVRVRALSTQCQNNLGQIGIALQNYKTTGDPLPKAADLQNKIISFMEGRKDIFACPASTAPTSYGTNICLPNFQPIDHKIAVIDANQTSVPFTNGTYDMFPTIVASRHQRVANALWYDGHVTAYDIGTINPYDPANGAAIVAQYWQPECGTCSQSGTTGTYYGSQTYSGGSSSRLETSLCMPFGAFENYGILYTLSIPGATPTAVPAFSAKFTGSIMANTSDNYTFYLSVDNEATVFINGSQIIYRVAGGWDGVGGVIYSQPSGPVPMIGGQWVPFEIDYVNYGGPAHICLQWSNSANPNPVDIPGANLMPN